MSVADTSAQQPQQVAPGAARVTLDSGARERPTLWCHLWAWTFGAVLVVWITLVAVAWSTGFREARKFIDGQLVATAQLWLASAPTDKAVPPPPPVAAGVDGEYIPDLAVLAWTDGRLDTDTHQLAAQMDLGRLARPGLTDVTDTNDTRKSPRDWRAYVVEQPQGARVRRVAVLVDQRERNALGLDLARAQRPNGPGAAGPSAVWLDLGEVAAQLVAEHAPHGHASGHELALLLPTEPVRVNVAPLLLALALRNLMANALRHTPPDTQIVVAVWRSSEAQGVSVSDDGKRSGAAPPRIGSDGLGLGLRLVERLAEQMGAQLERSVGTAPMTTCFSLRWPR